MGGRCPVARDRRVCLHRWLLQSTGVCSQICLEIRDHFLSDAFVKRVLQKGATVETYLFASRGDLVLRGDCSACGPTDVYGGIRVALWLPVVV